MIKRKLVTLYKKHQNAFYTYTLACICQEENKMDNLGQNRTKLFLAVVISILVSCEPYSDPSIAMKERLMGEWNWDRSISFDTLEVQTPASVGYTSLYIFDDNDMVKSYNSDTLYKSQSYVVDADIPGSTSFKLTMGDHTYNANLYPDTLVWPSNNYYHYFLRNK